MAIPIETKTAHSLLERRRTTDVLSSENINIDFASLLLSESVQKGLTSAGFEKPSPIQLQAIPLGRCGLDLIVQAKSGTGKTCVFSVIALESIIVTSSSLQVLVLAPTREIAVQVHSVIQAIGSAIEGLKCYTFIGGTIFGQDRQNLKKCHIAVGTPGRIKQLIEYEVMKTDSVRLFILDEADKLLDEKFQASVNWIYHQLPENKQMLALSATYPEFLAQQLTNYMRDPTFVRLNPKDLVLQGIKQFYQIVPGHELPHKAFEIKADQLVTLLSQVAFNQCLIFSNFQSRAQNLCDLLLEKGWPATFISGNQEQTDRMKAMMELKTYKCRILVSTDLTARGIDAENVNLIVNLDIPADFKTYLHRIGRAGRFGTHGAAISLASEGQEVALLKIVQKRSGSDIRALPDPLPSNLLEMSAGDLETTNLQSEEVRASPADGVADEGARHSETTDSTRQLEETGQINIKPELNGTNRRDSSRSQGLSDNGGLPNGTGEVGALAKPNIHQDGTSGDKGPSHDRRQSDSHLSGELTSPRTERGTLTYDAEEIQDARDGRGELSLDRNVSGSSLNHRTKGDTYTSWANENLSDGRHIDSIASVGKDEEGHEEKRGLLNGQGRASALIHGEAACSKNERMQELQESQKTVMLDGVCNGGEILMPDPGKLARDLQWKKRGPLGIMGLDPGKWIVPLAVVKEAKRRPRKRWTFDEALNLFADEVTEKSPTDDRVEEKGSRLDAESAVAGRALNDTTSRPYSVLEQNGVHMAGCVKSNSLLREQSGENLVNGNSPLQSDMPVDDVLCDDVTYPVEGKEPSAAVKNATNSHDLLNRDSLKVYNFEENYKYFENHDILVELRAITALSQRVRAEIADAQRESEETSQSEDVATSSRPQTLPERDIPSKNHGRDKSGDDASSSIKVECISERPDHGGLNGVKEHHESPVRKARHGRNGDRCNPDITNAVGHSKDEFTNLGKQMPRGGNNDLSVRRSNIHHVRNVGTDGIVQAVSLPEMAFSDRENLQIVNNHLKSTDNHYVQRSLGGYGQKLPKSNQECSENGQDLPKESKGLIKKAPKVKAPIATPSIVRGKDYSQCTLDDLWSERAVNDGRTSDKTWEYFKLWAVRAASQRTDEDTVESVDNNGGREQSVEIEEGILMKSEGAIGSLTTLDRCSVYSNKSNATYRGDPLCHHLRKVFGPSARGKHIVNPEDMDSVEAEDHPQSDEFAFSNRSSSVLDDLSVGATESLGDKDYRSNNVTSSPLDAAPVGLRERAYTLGSGGGNHQKNSGYEEADQTAGQEEYDEGDVKYPASHFPDGSGDGVERFPGYLRGYYEQGRRHNRGSVDWGGYPYSHIPADVYSYGYPYSPGGWQQGYGTPYYQYW